jgi:hypothetical protein
VYHGPIASLDGKYIYGDFATDHIYTSDFDRTTAPSTFDGANLGNLQEVSSGWESLILGGDPVYRDLEFPVDFAEDSQGNLFIVVFGNSATDSLDPGSVRGAAGLGIGEIYELVSVPEPASWGLGLTTIAAALLYRPRKMKCDRCSTVWVKTISTAPTTVPRRT